MTSRMNEMITKKRTLLCSLAVGSLIAASPASATVTITITASEVQSYATAIVSYLQSVNYTIPGSSTADLQAISQLYQNLSVSPSVSNWVASTNSVLQSSAACNSMGTYPSSLNQTNFTTCAQDLVGGLLAAGISSTDAALVAGLALTKAAGIPLTIPGTTSAVPTSSVNGTCGTSNGASSATAPSSNLCSTGSTSSVTGNGPWTWSCAGINGGTTATCSASRASGSGTGAETQSMTLRDAIYLYNQSFNGKGDKVLVGVDCDVFELVTSIKSGHANLTMGESTSLSGALGNATAYPDTLVAGNPMFAYSLYHDQPVKTFTFNDKSNPSSSSQTGVATIFGYCFSTKPTGHVYFQQKDTCTNTYSDGRNTSCTVSDNGSGASSSSTSMTLRDAIYLYDQPFDAKGSKTLVGNNCDVFQLILDVNSGYTDLAMSQANTLDGALANQSAYPDRIGSEAEMFSYALYSPDTVKTFSFKDKTNTASAAQTARSTTFGYCFSTNPAASVVLNENDSCTNRYSNGQVASTSCRGAGTGSAPVNGTCGPSNNVSLTAKPASGLCLTGSASSVAGTGPWTWTCAGNTGGASVACSANIAPSTPSCGSSSVQAMNPNWRQAMTMIPFRSNWTDLEKVYSDLEDSARITFSSLAAVYVNISAAISDYALSIQQLESSRLSVSATIDSVSSGSPNNPIPSLTDTCQSYWAPNKPSIYCSNRAVYWVYTDTITLQKAIYDGLQCLSGTNGPLHPVNGSCGSATATPSSNVPKSNFCNAGTPTMVTGGPPYKWYCIGSDGGSRAECSTAELSGSRPKCGPVNGTSVSQKPTSGLCDAGAVSDLRLADTGTIWSWHCRGSDTSIYDVGCNASVTVGVCGSADDQLFTTQPSSSQLCSVGSTVDFYYSSGSGNWNWTCRADPQNVQTDKRCGTRARWAQ